MTPYISDHAYDQADARNISEDLIRFVVQYGRREHAGGAIFCQMRRKDMPRSIRPSDPEWRAQGITVVICKCGQMVTTVYKNKQAFKKDRCKAKFDYRKQTGRTCPFCAAMTRRAS